MDGIDGNPVARAQRVDDRAARALDGQCDGSAGEALMQFVQPSVEIFRGVLQGALFDRVVVRA
jgi:hypothetical protein